MYAKFKCGSPKYILRLYAVRTRWVDYKDKEFDPYVMPTRRDNSVTADRAQFSNRARLVWIVEDVSHIPLLTTQACVDILYG